MKDPFLGENTSFLKFMKYMRMELSSDQLQWVFVTLFELVKMKKRHSSIMVGKLREGNHFANKWKLFVTFEHGTCMHIIQSIGYSPDLQVDPLSWVMSLLWVFENNALSTVVLCSASLSQCCQLFGRVARCSKGNHVDILHLQLKLLCHLLLSHSYGYIILKILELCFEFRVVDVRFIMSLLRWDYSCRLYLIIQELLLEIS